MLLTSDNAPDHKWHCTDKLQLNLNYIQIAVPKLFPLFGGLLSNLSSICPLTHCLYILLPIIHSASILTGADFYSARAVT